MLLILSTHKRSLCVHNAHHVTHESASNTHYVQRVFIAGQHHFRFTLLLVLSLSVVVFVNMLLYATLAHTHILFSSMVHISFFISIYVWLSKISEILPLLFVCTVNSTELNLGNWRLVTFFLSFLPKHVSYYYLYQSPYILAFVNPFLPISPLPIYIIKAFFSIHNALLMSKSFM